MSRLDPDRAYDDWVDRVDAGEECPECRHTDIKKTSSGPRFAVPLFECRLCGCLWHDVFTRPTLDDPYTIPLFPQEEHA